MTPLPDYGCGIRTQEYRVIFIGDNLPWDDVDVIYLEEHEVGQRYQAVFGWGSDWQPIGFVDWVRTLR